MVTNLMRFAAAVLVISACAGDPVPLTACTAGVQTACVCPGGATGAQRCAADGSAFGACECPDAAAPDVLQLADVVDVLERDVPAADLVTVDAQLRDVVDASSPADVVDAGPMCGPGFTLCSGVCVGLDVDVNNCGACGHVCTTTLPHARPSCGGSGCSFSCEPGWRNCNHLAEDGCEWGSTTPGCP